MNPLSEIFIDMKTNADRVRVESVRTKGIIEMRIVVGIIFWILSIPVKILFLLFALFPGGLIFLEDGAKTIKYYVTDFGSTEHTEFGKFLSSVVFPIIKWPW